VTHRKLVAKKVDRWTVDQMSALVKPLLRLLLSRFQKSTANFLEENDQRKSNNLISISIFTIAPKVYAKWERENVPRGICCRTCVRRYRQNSDLT